MNAYLWDICNLKALHFEDEYTAHVFHLNIDVILLFLEEGRLVYWRKGHETAKSY